MVCGWHTTIFKKLDLKVTFPAIYKVNTYVRNTEFKITYITCVAISATQNLFCVAI